jgi:hypothetical protein
MLKKFACAVAVILIGTFALAETLTGRITKATDKEVTIVTGKKGDRTTHKIAVTKDTKYVLLKGKKGSPSTLEALEEAIEKAGKRGVGGTVEVTDKKATEVSFRKGGKKKKKAE